MATVASKEFQAYCACGTTTKQAAIYHVIDSDGYTHENIMIAASIHDAGVDEDINNALAAKL